MGTIVERPGAKGKIAYSAQISIMRDGSIIHREAKTFYARDIAQGWIDKREKELAVPGALDRAKSDHNDPILADIIQRFTDESVKAVGRSKSQVLRAIKDSAIGKKRGSKIGSAEICDWVKSLNGSPSTRGTYASHLSSIFTVARPMWGYPLDRQAMTDAQIVLRKLGIISKSNERDRRPTLDELDKLMTYFSPAKWRGDIPMQKIIAFAIFSTRRQEEICRIMRADHEPGRIMVRDMKHPGEKIGNDVWCELVPEAEAIMNSMPDGPVFFPVNSKSVSTDFTRACIALGINVYEMPDEERLHFHDLRHEGISRLFEMAWTIPQVASVSGHRDWKSLKRYAHLRHTGDKYANWKWKDLK